MSQQPTSGGLLDIFGTGQSSGGGQGFSFDKLLNDPAFRAGIATLANNGNLNAGLQQAAQVSRGNQTRERQRSQDAMQRQLFELKQREADAALAQRADFQSMLGLNTTMPQDPSAPTAGPSGMPQGLPAQPQPGGMGPDPMQAPPQAPPQARGGIAGLTDTQKQIALSMGPVAGPQYLASVLGQPQFETVQDPYGRGGVGQVNSQTGQLSNYQKPETPDTVDAPSNVREWQFYNSLPPEDQVRFREMKRQNQFLDLGDRFVQPDSSAPGGVRSEFAQGVGPTDVKQTQHES